MREIIEEMSIAARQEQVHRPAIGRQRRFSIANYRTMVASARHRGAILGERPAVPRISDLGHLYSSSLGKLELDMMGSHQMSERQVLDAIMAEAIRNVFEEYVDRHGLEEIAEIFAHGVKIEVGDMLPSSNYAERLKRVPPAWDKAFEVNASSDAGRAGRRASSSCWPGCTPPTAFPARSSTGGSCMRSREEQHGIQPTHRRHHPHVPEVRPQELPQPDAAAARYGLAGPSSTC